MIPLPALKVALKLDPDDTSEDGYLEQVEAAAVAFVERTTGRYFGAPTERTEYLEGTGARELWLAETPADGETITVTSNDAAVDAEDFTVRGRRLRHTGYWGSATYPTDVVVTYTAGYQEGGEPADIKQAVLQLVTLWYEERLPVGDVPAEIPLHVREILNAHRRLVA